VGRRVGGRRARRVLWPYQFIAPAIALTGLVFVYPIVQVVRYSFYAGSTSHLTYVGTANYSNVIHDPVFTQSVLNNVKLLLTVPVMTVLALAIPVAVIVGLRHEHTVTVQSVFGAIAVYLDVGLLFALLISIAARMSDGPYFAQGGDGSMSERVYFSYVTLATLGYGDLTPVTDMGRLLSVAESIIGSLYLVTAVSLVVSRVGMPRMRIPADGDDER
jgi:hypothetical protein